MRLFTSDSSSAVLSFSTLILMLMLGLGTVFQATDALGCASCTGSTPEPVRQAYNISTAWLSFVPLIFMGSVAAFIYRMVKRGKSEE